MSTIRYEWDISDADNHLSAMLNGPPPDSVFLFESIFMGEYAQVQVDIHEDTDSLRQSGHADTDYGLDEFEGTMSFGGPSSGPIKNVRYAHIEMDRVGLRRIGQSSNGESGTPHDFYHSIRDYNPLYTDVITRFYAQSGRVG